ncbi:MAG: adenylate/guanylate cyclase domain-containing protein [Haliea sp.]|uniref:adenylate/guanylate cyclase domain-containing protein n=1 Tax=Haliea sp. TaxID=1932666 RepID=UPI0032EB695C
MDSSVQSDRVVAMVEALLARVGGAVPAAEYSALTQLAYNLLEPVPPFLPPSPRQVTVLIVDLRGFSSLAEICSSADLIDLLKPFFEQMTMLIHAHGGFVDKFLGDGVMALFGAPTPCDSHLQQALQCAARMQQAMAGINTENARRGLPEIHAGIGINTGEVMVGSFGPEDHREYTAIGDEVNFAARIESFSLRGQVLLSENSYLAARDSIEVGAMRRLQVKGRRGPVNLYEMLAVSEPERIEVPRVELRNSPRVEVELPLQFHRVDGNEVLQETHAGSIRNLGYDGMLAQLELELPTLSEINFRVNSDFATDVSGEVYARALYTRPIANRFEISFAFTTSGTAGHEAVRRYVDQLLWGRP